MSAPWRIKFVKAPCWGLMRFFTGRDARFYGRRGGLPAVEGGILQPCPRGRLQFDGERANAASGALDGRLFSTGMFSGMFTEMDWGPFQTHFRP